jgi:hypothetical protein
MSARYICLPAISQKLVQDVKGKRLEGAQQHIQINWKGSQIAKQVEFNSFSVHRWKVASSDSKISQLSQWHKKTQKLKYSPSKQKRTHLLKQLSKEFISPVVPCTERKMVRPDSSLQEQRNQDWALTTPFVTSRAPSKLLFGTRFTEALQTAMPAKEGDSQ